MSVYRMAVACCIAAVLWPLSGVSDAKALTVRIGRDAPILTVTHGAGTISVKEGKVLLQKIPYETEVENELKEMEVDLVSFEDMNFDGFLDLRIYGNVGASNSIFDCRLWNPKAKRFEKNDALSGLSNPKFDAAAKKVVTFEHNSATDNIEAAYEWRGGKLTELWRKSQSYDGERELFFVRVERLGDDGKMRLESEESLTGAAMEIYLETGEIPRLDEGALEKITVAAKALLGSELSGDARLHGAGITDGQPVRAWLFDLTNGDISCFETASNGSLYLNKGSDEGTFRIDFDGGAVGLGKKVD